MEIKNSSGKLLHVFSLSCWTDFESGGRGGEEENEWSPVPLLMRITGKAERGLLPSMILQLLQNSVLTIQIKVFLN